MKPECPFNLQVDANQNVGDFDTHSPTQTVPSGSVAIKDVTNQSSVPILVTPFPIPKKKYQCEICNKVFPTENSVYQHFNVHTGGNLIECDICNRRLSSKNSLRNHMSFVHDVDFEFKCNICRRILETESRLHLHMYFCHSGLREATCEHCQKVFKNRSQCRRHTEAVHLGLNRCECPHCFISVASSSALSRHIKRKHPVSQVYSCDACGRRFPTNVKLREHFDAVHVGHHCSDVSSFLQNMDSLYPLPDFSRILQIKIQPFNAMKDNHI